MVYQIRYEDKGSGRRQKVARPIKNRKELMALRNSKTNLRLLAKARDGDSEAKAKLLQLAYNIGYADGPLAGCKSQGSFFFHDVDCYDAAQSEAIRELILSKKDEIGLVMLERSVGGGWHLVCKRVPGTTILENQVRVATILQLEMDTSAKDLQRVVFSTSGSDEDLVYLDDILFTEPMSREECEAEFQRLKERQRQGKEEVPAGAKKANKHYRPWEDEMKNEKMKNEKLAGAENENKPEDAPPSREGCPKGEVGLSFKGIPYSTIIAEFWRRTGGEPVEGERNVRLYQLAANLKAICDNSAEKLLEVMPRLGLSEEEMQQIVGSACKETPKGISRLLRDILKKVGVEDTSGNVSLNLGGEAEGTESDIERMMWEWGMQIQAMMDDYPLLRDICKGLKPNQYPAALFIAAGFMMTLMTRCTYRFYHRPEELRRLNCSVLIIGDPASGKSFATRLFKLLTAPIVKSDRASKDAINAYRELVKTRGANKDKPKKPKVVLRIHPARTSNAQFIQDMVNSVEEVDGEQIQLHMLTFDSELDNTLRLQKGGGWIDKQAMELKAFHNEEDGQAYSNADSILEDFIVTWNYIYTGTPIALRQKVNSANFGSGLATRLTVVPLPTTNFEMMERTEADFDSDARLRLWAEKLDRTKGELSLGKIVNELYDWTARRMMDAKDNDSRADELLLKRCAYHGLNFAAPFIVMRHWDSMKEDGAFFCGEFETDETDWRLAEMLVNIQYACQRHFFGKMAEEYFEQQENEVNVNFRRKSKTIEAFNRLPEEFTAEEVVHVFQLRNLAAAQKRVIRLLKDNLVERTGTFVENGTTKTIYRKTGVKML